MPEAVIVALVKRRADLAGELSDAQGRINQLHADLAALDDVIKQFDPEYRIDSIRPRYRRQASSAETASMSRAVLDTLRRASAPLSVKAIASLIIAERGLNAEDRALVRSMIKRADMALRYQRTNGAVEASEAEGGRVVWQVAH